MPIEKCLKLGRLRAQLITTSLDKILKNINDPVITHKINDLI